MRIKYFPRKLPFRSLFGKSGSIAERCKCHDRPGRSLAVCGEDQRTGYEAWREEFGRRWIRADLIPIADDYIASEIAVSQLSFVTLGGMRGTPLLVDRRREFVAQDTSGQLSQLSLIFASGCRAQVCQRGRSVDLAPGDMTLGSGSEAASVTQLTDGNRWSIRIPYRQVADVCRNVEDKILRPIANSELGNLLLHQIETAHRFGPKLDAVANHVIAQYILDLIALCLGAVGDAAEIAKHRGLAAARLDAIKVEILQWLGRPDLGLAQIAAKHGVSTRYIQYLFGRSGESFSGFVLEQRLLAAHRLLREPKSRWRKVSDIAATAGFSDISYFNRAFRARFGATPTDIRASFGGDARFPLAAADDPSAR
jgi:AraC-like DNA-binding protein